MSDEERLVEWTGDIDSDDTPGDYYEEPTEKMKEPFAKIVARSRAKWKAGEPLTPKEKWAWTHANKHPGLMARTGPRKSTLALLDKIVKLQVEEGLSYSELADRLEKSPTTIAHVIGRHDREYRKALDRLAEDASRDAGIRRPVIYARLLSLYQRTALRSALITDEIMMDPQQPGGVRLKAAENAAKMFDMGKEIGQTAQQSPSQETIQAIKDTIGVMARLRALTQSTTIEAEVEVVNETSTD
jgi:hypothetical protein